MEKRIDTKEEKRSSRLDKVLLFFRESQWFWGIAFIVVILFLFTAHFHVQPPPDWQIGSVATKEVRAPFDLQVQDEIATSAKRKEAKEKVPPVYDWDTEMGNRLQERLSRMSQKARGILQERDDAASNPALSKEEKNKMDRKCRSDLEELMGPDLTRYALHQFEREGFSPALEETLRAILKKAGSRKIVSDEDDLSIHPLIKIRDIHKQSTEWEIRSPASGEIISISTARRFSFELLDAYENLTPSTKAASEEILRLLLKPTLTFNSQETVLRQDAAAKDVSPLVVFIRKGQPVIRAGEVVDENVKQRLQSFQLASQNKINIKRLLALLFLSIALLLFAFMYLKSYKKREKIAVNLFNIIVVLLLFFMVLTHISDTLFKLLAANAKDFPMSRADLGLFLIPFAAGALLVTVLIDRHIAVVYSFLLSIFVGMLLDLDFRVTLFSFITSLAAIYAGVNFRQKRIPLKTSLFVALSNVVLVMLFLADDDLWARPEMMLYPVLLGFLSAMPLLLMLVTPLLPILESFYGIVSDVKLVELSSLNHPLLQRLALTAPGTYNHSIMISHIAESAASTIGANGLFCRVASYYHDVGKVLNSNYFIENQQGAPNPHDKLTPRVSALIVQSHVREGIFLAGNHKLPKQIIDIIPQHHGTRNISYFYDKALTIVDPEKETINKSDFCYPGPKPSSKEAAIIMLADSIEASSRVLKDPSPQRVRTLIDEVFDKILLDNQLDECDITLNELALLREGFFKVLMGVFARRISYPNYDFDKGQKDG
jgi:cyclic-di-AMP phosphodiesterase PgpH